MGIIQQLLNAKKQQGRWYRCDLLSYETRSCMKKL